MRLKQENLENTQNRKTEKTLDRNFNQSDVVLVNILTDLEQIKSFSSNAVSDGVNNLDLKFEEQGQNKITL